MKKSKISGWGLYPSQICQQFSPQNKEELQYIISSLNEECIARGNGRSYGDSALNLNNTISTLGLNKFLSYDRKRGVLECQSGVLLSDIFDIFLPKGWISPVTPGTKFVTIGGMIASDIHGKNHHIDGSFCNHILEMKVLNSENKIITCSEQHNSDLFFATCGGMGLTGIIISATIQMKQVSTAFIQQTVISTKNFKEAVKVFNETASSTYSVAWIDCLAKGKSLGRSVIFLGEHVPVGADFPKNLLHTHLSKNKKFSIPFFFPSFILNKFSIMIFNALYYFINSRKPKSSIIDLETFFYPLDNILNWNKIYGRKGFIQYQCVIPRLQSEKGITELLETISQSGQGSFLAVLKMFGPSKRGFFSFPCEGLTLALDFKINNKTFQLCEQLDEIVCKYNGHLYLTKDARQSSNMFNKTHPGVEELKTFRKTSNANKIFSSLQSQRLKL